MEKPKLCFEDPEIEKQVINYKYCVTNQKYAKNLQSIQNDHLEQKDIDGIIQKYKRHVSEQKIISLTQFLNAIQKDNENMSVDFVAYGSYGIIFKFGL